MSEFWGKRWAEAAWKKTKSIFQRTHKPEKHDQDQEKKQLNIGISWFKERRKSVLNSFLTIAALGSIVAISVTGHIYVKNNTSEIYHVYVGDTLVGTVSDQNVVEELIDEKEALIRHFYPELQMELAYDPITFSSERGFKLQSDDEQTLENIENLLTIKTYGTEIWVDGEMIGVVKNEEEAEKLLEQYKEKYLPSNTKGRVQVLSVSSDEEVDDMTEITEVEKVEFLEQVELKTAETSPESISPSADILHKLELGDTVPFQYTVQKGDCISCIAAKFDLTTEFIYQNNPDLDSDFIQIGDVLDLTVEKPALSVQTTETTKVIEDIPFEIIYEDDPEMRKGLQEVLVEGQVGKKRVEYEIVRVNGVQISKEVVAEQVLEQPQSKVIKRGTKVIAGVGTGSFQWPVSNPQVTSSYGPRWGTTHKGTDMVSSNKTIMAADSGTVTFAGWKNGYGNAIIIDHKNGYETLYGHLSEISVSTGEKVEKGDAIGIMGNTGDSYGVHLHFEIHKDGVHQDPEDYL